MKVFRGVAAISMAVGMFGVTAVAQAQPVGFKCNSEIDPCCDFGFDETNGATAVAPPDPCAEPVPVEVLSASVRGTAFEDLNENGKRDAGEPTMAGAWWKVADAGAWYVCGFTGNDATYAVPVVETGMTYFVYPIAPVGWRTTTPVLKTKTADTSNGIAFLRNDLGFVRDASVKTVEACSQYSPARATQPSILMTANSAGTFKTLVAAAIAAGLANTLNMDGAYTVFAPTDAAFAKLPAGTVEALLKDPVKLAGILKYHIVGDRVPASQVVKMISLTTLQGGKLTVSLAGGGVMINNAKVLATDIMASNGIVHVIDTVLLP